MNHQNLYASIHWRMVCIHIKNLLEITFIGLNLMYILSNLGFSCLIFLHLLTFFLFNLLTFLIWHFGIGLESPRTTMFNMYYNGIKRMLRDGCAGIPNLCRHFILSSFALCWVALYPNLEWRMFNIYKVQETQCTL